MRIKSFGLVAVAGIAPMLLNACATNGYGSDYRSEYARGPSTPYYAEEHYRDDPRYRERHMGRGDQIYAGRDGRYYCKRSDGSAGLIVGGIAGGVLGNIIAPGGSKTLGTILGAGVGAAAGSAIQQDQVRCH